MSPLDLIDKKIITALNQNVRATYTQIAKLCRSSKEVVSYRINRLEQEGIIKEYVTIFGFPYWSNKILVQLEQMSPEQEQIILHYLSHHPNINWVTPCSGNWDLVFAIVAKDPLHFDQLLRTILQNLGPHLQDYKVSTSVGSKTFGHTYILGTTKEDTAARIKAHTPYEFDEKDKLIAKSIHRNARKSLTSIAAETSIPIDTVKYHLKRMIESNVIRRFRLIIEPSKLGYNRCEVFIRCVNLTDQIVKKFQEYGKQKPYIEYFSKSVGSWDIEYTIHFKTNEELRSIILDIKQEFGKYIKNFESVTLFQTINYTSLPEELR